GRIAGRRLARAGLSARLARARAQALPFPSRVFDSAVTTFPAAYIAEAATADEVRRVLRPGGRLVLVPAAGFKGNSLRRRAVNGLFALTGQGTGQAGAAEPGFWRQALAAYGRAGFKLDIRPTAVGDSRVTIITADLPD
ncbi:MAG: methyltransferase domain-containing protein, partial [Candidatus Promineifilaceae bacterium]